MRPVLDRLSRSPVADTVRGLKHRSGRRGYAPMKPATRQRLLEYFAPHNAALRQLTGLAFPGWDA